MPSGFDKERETLETYFKDNFTAAPIQFSNVPFQEPASGKFVRFTILNGESSRRALGADALRRHPGAVSVQIFTPAEGGEKSGRVLADSVVAVLQEKTMQSGTDWIELRDATLTPLGKVENGRFQHTVTVPFIRDEH
jgi:hypothetical protein